MTPSHDRPARRRGFLVADVALLAGAVVAFFLAAAYETVTGRQILPRTLPGAPSYCQARGACHERTHGCGCQGASDAA